MDLTFLFFLSSGLFLGWSLGANDAANVFGTAVGSRMMRFSTAAMLTGLFVVLGAVVGGAGASHGLGQLGAVNALAGSFTVALSAAGTVYGMTKLGLPVSTTQAVVGGILGWNFFSKSATDISALTKIVGTWVVCPILAAVFSLTIYLAVRRLTRALKPHVLWQDQGTRIGYVLVGIFGAYSLGANNIANVVGVFLASSPLKAIHIGDVFSLSAAQRLFMIGGAAIGFGAFYSKPVMMTVGKNIVRMNPVGGLVVGLAQALVLFVFSSSALRGFVTGLGLPPIPLVPVSSSQAVVGAVIGIAFTRGIKGARQVRWGVLRNIVIGWVATPVIAAIICWFGLFFVQNVFEQQVYR